MLELFHEALIIKITTVINNVLQEHTDVKEFSKLHGKVIKLQVYNVQYYITFFDKGIKLNQEIKSPDLFINISSIFSLVNLSLGGLIKSQSPSVSGFAEVFKDAIQEQRIELSGDLSVAMALQVMFENSQFNLKEVLQEQLAKVTSDLFAWQFIGIVDKIINRIKIQQQELAWELTDYLQLERNLLISKCEVSQFYQEVDKLREDVDRIAARIELLC